MTPCHSFVFGIKRLLVLLIGVFWGVLANATPSIGVLCNQVLLTNSSFSVTITGATSVSAQSDRTAILRNSDISVVNSSGTTWTVTLNNGLSAVGASLVSLIASDGTSSVTKTFIASLCSPTMSTTVYSYNSAAINESLGCGTYYTTVINNGNTRFAPGRYNIYADNTTSGHLILTQASQYIYADSMYSASIHIYYPSDLQYCGIWIMANSCTVSSLSIVLEGSTTATYGLLIGNYANNVFATVIGTTITNCYFNGSCGNYLRDQGTASSILKNQFMGSYINHVAREIAIDHDTGFYVYGNSFGAINNDMAIQVNAPGWSDSSGNRYYASGTIISNTFYNTMHSTTTSYVAGQSDYSFSTIGGIPGAAYPFIAVWVASPTSNQCWGVNGGLYGLNWTKSSSGSSLLVHLNNTGIIPANSTLYILGWFSKEPINIDGDSHDVWIAYNSFQGSGDSGIMVCNDLKASQPNANDPYNIICDNNYFEYIAYAGIAFQNYGTGCKARGNTFMSTGIGNWRIYYDGTNWTCQTPWSTCVFAANTTSNNYTYDIDYGTQTNYKIANSFLNSDYTRTANYYSDPAWMTANPF